MSNPRVVPEPIDLIKELRRKILSLIPGNMGLSSSDDTPHVWGVLMETGYAEALASLVCLADGTTSLYLGTGGGMIGGGEHTKVREAAREFLAAAEYYRKELEPAKTFPYPEVGRVRFYVFTFSGPLTADAGESELGHGKHRLSNFFYAAHGVLTELRQVDEKLNK